MDNCFSFTRKKRDVTDWIIFFCNKCHFNRIQWFTYPIKCCWCSVAFQLGLFNFKFARRRGDMMAKQVLSPTRLSIPMRSLLDLLRPKKDTIMSNAVSSPSKYHASRLNEAQVTNHILGRTHCLPGIHGDCRWVLFPLLLVMHNNVSRKWPLPLWSHQKVVVLLLQTCVIAIIILGMCPIKKIPKRSELTSIHVNKFLDWHSKDITVKALRFKLDSDVWWW